MSTRGRSAGRVSHSQPLRSPPLPSDVSVTKSVFVGLTFMLPTCRQATLLLDVLDDTRVPIGTRLGARFHLRFCDKCHRFAAQYRATAAVLRALATPPSDVGLNAFRAWRARG